MVSALTISLALYLFLIIVPGYISLIIAGYPSEKVSFVKILIRGALIFLFVNLIIIHFGDENTIEAFMSILKEGKVINSSFLYKTISYIFITGVIFGFLQLLFDFTLVWYIKKELKFFTPLRILQKNTIDVSPGDSLKRLFTCYRIANKRPLVKIYLGSKQDEMILTGEVLSFKWNGHEHILLKDTNSLKIAWLNIGTCKAIEFLNLKDLIKESSDNKTKNLRKEKGEILDMIHPGLSEYFLDENGNEKCAPAE